MLFRKRHSGKFGVYHVAHRRGVKKSKLKISIIVLPVFMFLILAGGIWLSIKENQAMFMELFSNSSQQTEEAVAVLQTKEEKEKLLTVVNLQRSLPTDYSLDLVRLGEIYCDQMIVESLDKMVKAAKQDGVVLMIEKGYIPIDQQNQLYDQKVKELMDTKGFTIVKAQAEAEKLIPPGGKSEYQTGLSIKIAAGPDENGKSFIETNAYKWVTKNCVEYGFVIRYPKAKEDETGITFDPSYYRYVGVENAKKMRALDFCLEEYTDYMQMQKGI